MTSREKFIEQLFLCTLDDIRERRVKGKGRLYDCIRCAGMLRQLLMDGKLSLVDLANKRHKLKIVYEVADHSNRSDKTSPRQWLNLAMASDRKIKKVNRETFIKTPIALWDGHTYNVGDLIDYYSHFLGGIHAGEPKGEKENLFLTINKSFPILKDWPSISFYDVVSIALKAFEPLEDAIKGHASWDGL